MNESVGFGGLSEAACRDGTVHRWGAFPEVIFGGLTGSHWVGPEKSRVGRVVGRVPPPGGGVETPGHAVRL